MEILTIKSIVLVLMLVITLIASMAPLAFIRTLRKTRDETARCRLMAILSLLSCFAGGVFLGTCILDLFPDVQEQIDSILANNPPEVRAFPFAEFIVVCGFLLVLTAEQIVLWFKEQHEDSLPPPALQDSIRFRQELDMSGVVDRPDFTASMRSDRSNSIPYNSMRDESSNDDAGNNPTLTPLDAASLHSPLRTFLLLIALSLHSCFEGMAVGLQADIRDTVALFMIVILHKSIISFSLGLNMVTSRMSLSRIVTSNLFFSLTAPVGVGLGMLVQTYSGTSEDIALIGGVLQGIACGTFLYVTFFEVLPHELNNGSYRLWKVLCVILGFSAVCGLMYIEPSQRTRD